jgi:monoamine oxidase
VLAEPVAPCLAFAGEACSAARFGTVPGAWDSGLAAARRLLSASG